MAAWAFVLLGIGACGEEETPPAPAPPTSPAPSSSAAPYRLVAGGTVLVGPGKKRTPVQPGAIVGFVDNVTPAEETLNVTGWAAAGDFGRPVDRVVGLVAGAGVAEAKATGERPDVVEAYDEPALRLSGFVLNVGKASLDCSESAAGLAVFGIVDGVAGPIAWAEGSDQALSDEAC